MGVFDDAVRAEVDRLYPSLRTEAGVRKIVDCIVLTREMYDDFRRMRLLLEGFTWRPCEECGQTVEVDPSGAYWHMSLAASTHCNSARIDGKADA